jgi:hypothetical protein
MKMKEENPILKEGGQTFVIVVLLLVVLIGFVGFGTDLGYLRFKKQQMRKAADAGAIAGASEIPYANWEAAAKEDSKKNGFEDGKDNVTVTVNRPPLSGPHVAGTPNADNYVEVIITQPQPTFFMKVMGMTSAMVKARAVAVFGSSPACMFALARGSVSNAFRMHPGGPYGLVLDCGIVINSSSSSALDTSDSPLTADFIGIVGCGDSGPNVTPTPTCGISPVEDPLAYLPNPTPSGPSRPNPNISAPGDYTLQPGIYNNGITIGYQNGKAGPNVFFAPGEYYITGGNNFIVNSPKTDNNNADGLAYQHPNLYGSDVFIYIGSGSQVDYQSGNQHFANSYGGLSAPTTGPYAGILFYQARGNTNKATVSSGLGDGYTGALYFPSAALKYSNSNPSSANYMIFVAQTLEFYRDMAAVQTINSDYTSLPGGSPIHSAVLAE